MKRKQFVKIIEGKKTKQVKLDEVRGELSKLEMLLLFDSCIVIKDNKRYELIKS